MKALGMVLLCLLMGAIACYISMLALVTPAHRTGGSWDLSPLAGIIFGAPTWLIAFPSIYFLSRSKAQDRPSAYIFATVGSFALTIAVPFILRSFGSH